MVEVTITGGTLLKGRRLRATDLYNASQKFCIKDGISLTFGIPGGKGQDWSASSKGVRGMLENLLSEGIVYNNSSSLVPTALEHPTSA